MSLKSSTNTAVNTHELILEIDAKKFNDAIEAVYKKQKGSISIPGFRKGKAPRKMIEAEYGEGTFYNDAINSLLGEELAEAVKEANLELVDQPSVEAVSVDREAGVVLKATCTTKPEVKISEYKGLKAPKLAKTITDEDVMKQINGMLERNARIISVDDRAAQLEDEVTIDFEGFKDGVAFDGGKGNDFPLTLGSGQFIPGFEEQVVGHNIGEEFDINVTFPENYQMEELAGQPAVFKIKLKAISVKELPELNDDFVKDSSDFDTVDELKKDVKDKMEEQAEKAAAVGFENKVFEQIIDNVEAEIPDCMVESRVNGLVSDFEQSLKAQGMSLDMYLQYTGMDEDSFKETFRDRAANEVRLRLGLQEIAKIENIDATDEEIDKSLSELAANNGMDLESVKRFVPIDAYKADVVASKVADFVKENAIVDNTLAETEEDKEESAE